MAHQQRMNYAGYQQQAAYQPQAYQQAPYQQPQAYQQQAPYQQPQTYQQQAPYQQQTAYDQRDAQSPYPQQPYYSNDPQEAGGFTQRSAMPEEAPRDFYQRSAPQPSQAPAFAAQQAGYGYAPDDNRAVDQ